MLARHVLIWGSCFATEDLIEKTQLTGNGDLGMSIQHQLQQRGAGATGAHDEKIGEQSVNDVVFTRLATHRLDRPPRQTAHAAPNPP